MVREFCNCNLKHFARSTQRPRGITIIVMSYRKRKREDIDALLENMADAKVKPLLICIYLIFKYSVRDFLKLDY